MRRIYQKNLAHRNVEVRPVKAWAETPGSNIKHDKMSDKDARNEEQHYFRQQKEKARKLKELQLEIRQRVEHFRRKSPTKKHHKGGTCCSGISDKDSPRNSTANDASFLPKDSTGEKLLHVTLTAPEGGHLLSLLSSPFDGNQEQGSIPGKRKLDVTPPFQKTEAGKKRLHVTLTTPYGKQLLSLITSPAGTSQNATMVRERRTSTRCVSVKPGVEKELNRQRMLQELLQRKRLLSNDERRRMKSESERRKENVKASRYHIALKANVRRRIKELNLDIPPLCPCHPSVWDADTNFCAVNCVFYKKPQIYDQLLQSMVANFTF